MGVGYNPKIVTKNLLLSLDFANQKNYISGITASSTITPYTFTFKNGSTYNSIANGILTTNRALSVTTKTNDGGGIYTTALGSLAATTFLYSDHTWEIWVKINDKAPSNYDANETASMAVGFGGIYASVVQTFGGYYFTNTTMVFSIWNGTTDQSYITWKLDTAANAPITNPILIVGNWYQIVATRTGNTLKGYINGVPSSTAINSIATSTVGVTTTNVLSIGSCGSQSDFISYAKMDFSNTKMYNRALSDEEIWQNFLAHRRRFGI